MVIIYVAAEPKPGASADFEQTIEHVARDARALDGCSRYEWFRHSSKPNRYVVYGEFESRASFDSYQKSSVVARIGSDLMPMLIGPPEYHHVDGEVFESSGGI